MPAMKKKKKFQSSLHVIEYKDGDRFIAHCLEFDLVAQGSTSEEARDNLADLTFSYLHFGMEKDIEQFSYHPAPKVYWDKFKQIHRKKVLSRHSVDPALLKVPKNRIKDFMEKVETTEAPTHA